MSEPTKFLLAEDADPDALGEPDARPAGRAAAAAAARGTGARRPGRPHADLPDGADRAGGLDRAGGRDPRRGARDLQAVAPDAAVPRAPARARARHAGAHLLQVRGRLAGRLAQAEHRGPAGVRERARPGVKKLVDRDRRRPVGLGARVRVRAVRARVRGLHGRLELRPEALPPLDDGDVGRDRAPLPLGPHEVGPRAGRRTRPARSASRSPRRSRSPPATRTRTTRSAPC